uniref:Uncharacterized protein n=1 Tax=Medicago truncatula TaxID=3880 RepID=Q2HSZ8_MEDTR|nr:hypothetical protein MtrDRAFT_AC150889g4v2 [Medicago truncatula]
MEALRIDEGVTKAKLEELFKKEFQDPFIFVIKKKQA